MNRQILVQILKMMLEKYIANDSYTEKELEEIIKNTTYKPVNDIRDNNWSSYYEQHIIAILFEKVPYYQILPLINEFQSYLKNNYKNNKTIHSITIILNGYLMDLFNVIRERVKQEVYLHLYYALTHYTPNKGLIISNNIFLKNLYNPNDISNLEVVEQIKYEQVNLFGEKQANLSEAVSKLNSKKKDAIINIVKKYLQNNLDSNSIDNFISVFLIFIEKIPDINPYTKEHLITMYLKELNYCLSSNKDMEKKSDGYSYVYNLV